MLSRVSATVLALLLYGMACVVYAPEATLLSGRVGGPQFNNSDTGYITSAYWMHFLIPFPHQSDLRM